MSHTSRISHQVLEEYNELVQDTVYNLELRLLQIDEKMTRFTMGNIHTSGATVDLENEKEVTKQCLRVCEDARSYIDSLSNREASLLRETSQTTAEGEVFEAQWRTRQALDENRYNFAETIDLLQKRLDRLIQDNSPEKDNERSQLQADIDTSKQMLNVCKVAREVSRQTVYRIGEVIAEGKSDQVVVTTLADLFDIKKALSKDESAQLVGSMDASNLHHLTEKRYNSRFAAVPGHLDTTVAGATQVPAVFMAQKSKPAAAPQKDSHEQSTEPRPRQNNRPHSNEMRRRQMDGAGDYEKGRTTER